MSHFLESFDSDQDVIYGMGKWIHYYIYNYYWVWKGYLDPAEQAAYVPKSMPKEKFSQAHDAYQKNVINLYNEPMREVGIEVQKGKTVDVTSVRPENLPDDPILRDFFHRLQRSTDFGPESLQGGVEDLRASIAAYQGGTSTMDKEEYTSKVRGAIKFILKDIAIRRSCKFGVDYFSSKGTVHYILDELDIETVVANKMVRNATTRKMKVPICTSEILYIFRQWNKLKGGSKMKFWNDFQEVPAPWHWDKWRKCYPDWARFAIQHFHTHRDKIPQANQTSFLASQALFQRMPGNPVLAQRVIESFHAIPAALVNRPDETGAGSAENNVAWHLVAAPVEGGSVPPEWRDD